MLQRFPVFKGQQGHLADANPWTSCFAMMLVVNSFNSWQSLNGTAKNVCHKRHIIIQCCRSLCLGLVQRSIQLYSYITEIHCVTALLRRKSEGLSVHLYKKIRPASYIISQVTVTLKPHLKT